MCNVWEEASRGELAPLDIESIFSGDLFSDVEHLGISGGEPTLRKDLPVCVKNIIASLPKLKSISITSHGYHYNRWSRFLPDIAGSCEASDVDFTLNLSLDGLSRRHEQIRGTKGAFDRVFATVDIAKQNGVKVQLQSTLSKENVYSAPLLLEFAKEVGVEIVFRIAVPVARLDNYSVIDDRQLHAHQRSFLADFFRYSDVARYTKSPGRRLYYKRMEKWLVDGGERRMPCSFQNEGMLISAKGDAYFCSIQNNSIGSFSRADSSVNYFDEEVRRQHISDTCPKCMHDQSGQWSPLNLACDIFSMSRLNAVVLLVRKYFRSVSYIIEIIYNSGVATRNRTSAIPADIEERQFDSALLIGAYGGEHVGDAAILGGVILRLKKRHGVKNIKVGSFRPHRTQRWVDSIVIPGVSIDVVDDSLIGADVVSNVDQIVYAGGPMMELPFRHLNHLRIVSIARSLGIPFSIEGVGIGPIKRRITNSIITKLIKLSGQLSVRSSKSKEFASLIRDNVRLGADPAFDYLRYSSQRLTNNFKSYEDAAIAGFSDLLESDGPVIGINLRPLSGAYVGSKGSLETYNEIVVEKVAAALVKVVRALPRAKFVYFAMNADQFGESDFNIGYSLLNALKQLSIELEILDCEFGVDAMTHVMKSMDCILSMRFHGCIFGLSNNPENVLGIDYLPSGKGKIYQLYKDMGQENRVFSIDSIDSSKLSLSIIQTVRQGDANTSNS